MTHGVLATFSIIACLQPQLTTHFVLLLPLLPPPIFINTHTYIMKNGPTPEGFKIPQKILYLASSLCSILNYCILPPLAGVQKSPHLSTLEKKLTKSRALSVLNSVPLKRQKVRALLYSDFRPCKSVQFFKKQG